MPEIVLQLLANNWVWALGMGLSALLAYWWWEERQDASDATETIDRLTDRAEAATGGALEGTRALVVGVAGIGVTVAMEMLQLATELNEVLGGVPFIAGYVIYGILSFVGISIGLDPRTLGFLFVLILVAAAMARFGGDD